MTSSLVGSEMCIRDRGLPIEGVATRANVVAVLLWGEPNERTAFGVGAVSYTHLTLPTICSV
eukprot:7915181-Prorocentrum_lima.AAC.1